MYSAHAIQHSNEFGPPVVHRFVYFDCQIIKRSTDFLIRRSSAAAHNKLPHAVSPPFVGGIMAKFCTEVAEDKGGR